MMTLLLWARPVLLLALAGVAFWLLWLTWQERA
jgi:hypothetical protein